MWTQHETWNTASRWAAESCASEYSWVTGKQRREEGRSHSETADEETQEDGDPDVLEFRSLTPCFPTTDVVSTKFMI